MHHEKIDGSGFSMGTKYIPWEVQIVTVADMYDSLCEKHKIEKENAIRTLKEKAAHGKIDMSIVDALECPTADCGRC